MLTITKSALPPRPVTCRPSPSRPAPTGDLPPVHQQTRSPLRPAHARQRGRCSSVASRLGIDSRLVRGQKVWYGPRQRVNKFDAVQPTSVLCLFLSAAGISAYACVTRPSSTQAFDDPASFVALLNSEPRLPQREAHGKRIPFPGVDKCKLAGCRADAKHPSPTKIVTTKLARGTKVQLLRKLVPCRQRSPLHGTRRAWCLKHRRLEAWFSSQLATTRDTSSTVLA